MEDLQIHELVVAGGTVYAMDTDGGVWASSAGDSMQFNKCRFIGERNVVIPLPIEQESGFGAYADSTGN
jgi:hypothetical protein